MPSDRSSRPLEIGELVGKRSSDRKVCSKGCSSIDIVMARDGRSPFDHFRTVAHRNAIGSLLIKRKMKSTFVALLKSLGKIKLMYTLCAPHTVCGAVDKIPRNFVRTVWTFKTVESQKSLPHLVIICNRSDSATVASVRECPMPLGTLTNSKQSQTWPVNTWTINNVSGEGPLINGGKSENIVNKQCLLNSVRITETKRKEAFRKQLQESTLPNRDYHSDGRGSGRRILRTSSLGIRINDKKASGWYNQPKLATYDQSTVSRRSSVENASKTSKSR